MLVSKRKRANIQKKRPITTPITRPDIEIRNAFRVLKRSAALTGDQVSGDLSHLPITITYAPDVGRAPDIMRSYQEVLLYGVETLRAVGFSLEGALNVLFSAKATKDVIRDMYTK